MIVVEVNSIDVTNLINVSDLSIDQNLTSQVDTAFFRVRKYGARTFTPAIGDPVVIYDDSEKAFSGSIVSISEAVESGGGDLVYDVTCIDATYELDGILVAESFENRTIKYIIDYIVTNYAPTFTTNNVMSTFVVPKIVFNQISISQCLRRLASMLKNEWYVDAERDIHFFSKFSNLAPFNLTDTSGNYVYKSLQRKIDGTQIANQVKVRGGLGTETNLFTDVITVKGDDSLSFKLPFKFGGLAIRVDSGAGYVEQSVGAEFLQKLISEGGTYDVLYNFQDDSIRFGSALSDDDKIEFSGYRKYPILAIATDNVSVATYGLREKIIKDNSIEDATLARRRASAELETYKLEISDGTFRTYTRGLRTGMVINLSSTLRNATVDFLIKKVKTKTVDPNTFLYEVEVVTTQKYSLIELLQKILQPEDTAFDSSEVAELLKTDTVNISIGELIEAMSAVEDIVDVEVVEVIQKDPLGAGVEPEWVLAEYFPTDITDPKREGRLNLSFKLS